MNIKAHIPNTITCLNLICGAAAIVLALHGSVAIGALTGFEWSFIAIGAAAVFDFCDGAAARMLKAYSALGKELDSLSDLVSFGLAPAAMVYTLINETAGGFTLWSVFALSIAVCGALRLARFNIDSSQSTTFTGLPIPANAIFWIGACSWATSHGCPPFWAFAAIIVCESLLMLSSLRMSSLKFKNFDWRDNFRRYVLIIAALMFVVTSGLPGLMWTILFYIIMSAVGRKE